MRKTTVFYTHFLSLSAFFILGGSISEIPVVYNKNTTASFLLTLGMGAVFTVFILFLDEFALNCKKNTPPFQAVRIIILVSVSVYSLFVLADTLTSFFNLLKNVMLSRNFMGSVLFLAVCLFYFFARRQEDILKFSLITFLASFTVLLGFAVFLIPNYRFENLALKEIPQFKNIFSQSFFSFKKIFLPVIVLVFYKNFVFPVSHKSAMFSGIIMGSCILLFCVLCPILIFGTEFCEEIAFPLNSALSTLSTGRLFGRMDAFVYLIYIVSTLLKSAVCFFVSITALKTLANRKI